MDPVAIAHFIPTHTPRCTTGHFDLAENRVLRSRQSSCTWAMGAARNLLCFVIANININIYYEY